MTEVVLSEHSDILRSLALFTPIRAVQFGLKSNPLQLFSILELYNSDSCTFFTLDGELGMAMHEMHEVSGLPMGEVPYEEFIPGSSELKRLRSEHPTIHETYWELMCHYHICFDQICGKKKTGVYVSHKNWADYLFENLDKKGVPVAPLGPSDRVTVETRIFESLPVLFTLGT